MDHIPNFRIDPEIKVVNRSKEIGLEKPQTNTFVGCCSDHTVTSDKLYWFDDFVQPDFSGGSLFF